MPAEMNEHIRQGNLALNAGDRDRAATEFYEALEDPDPLTQRIARNRLMELFPETVFAKTHSYQSLYNRPNCAAKNVIWSNHIVWFRDWREGGKRSDPMPCVQTHA